MPLSFWSGWFPSVLFEFVPLSLLGSLVLFLSPPLFSLLHHLPVAFSLWLSPQHPLPLGHPGENSHTGSSTPELTSGPGTVGPRGEVQGPLHIPASSSGHQTLDGSPVQPALEPNLDSSGFAEGAWSSQSPGRIGLVTVDGSCLRLGYCGERTRISEILSG